ncbi:MAG: hypothetical protein R3B06_03885 [Kofleriaceae bacterium]
MSQLAERSEVYGGSALESSNQRAPGKRALTDRLVPRNRARTDAVADTVARPRDQPTEPLDDPFALHLPSGQGDLAELDQAYEGAATAQGLVMNKRMIGVDEVNDNLAVADPPPIADELLKSLAVAALGAVSGYVTAVIASRLVGEGAAALNNAVQTALDDGLKDAATKVAGRIAGGGGGTKASFFAAQKEAVAELQASTQRALSAEKRAAREAVAGVSADERAGVIAAKVKDAHEFDRAATATATDARSRQYRESLARWMSAQSQAALGSAHDGTELAGAVKPDALGFFKRTPNLGVIEISLGQRSAKGPFAVDGSDGRIRVKGLTSAARDGVKDVPIKDLGIAIVVFAVIADGFLDAVGNAFGGGQLKFGRNESGWVWWQGSTSAAEAVVAAQGTKEIIGAVVKILEEQVGAATLANATVVA